MNSIAFIIQDTDHGWWKLLPSTPVLPRLWASQVVLMVKSPSANAGDARDAGSVPGSGRSPGVGNGTPLQYSCLRNPMDSEARWARVHGATKSWPRPAHPHTPPHTSITLLPVTVLWYPTSFAKSEIITEGRPCPPFPHLSITRFPHMWYFLYYTLSGHPHKSQASRQPAMAAFAPRINSWAMGDNLGNIKNMVAAKMPQYFPLVIPI